MGHFLCSVLVLTGATPFANMAFLSAELNSNSLVQDKPHKLFQDALPAFEDEVGQWPSELRTGTVKIENAIQTVTSIPACVPGPVECVGIPLHHHAPTYKSTDMRNMHRFLRRPSRRTFEHWRGADRALAAPAPQTRVRQSASYTAVAYSTSWAAGPATSPPPAPQTPDPPPTPTAM